MSVNIITNYSFLITNSKLLPYGDFVYAQLDGTTGNLDFHLVAHLVVQQALGDGRSDGNLALSLTIV